MRWCVLRIGSAPTRTELFDLRFLRRFSQEGATEFQAVSEASEDVAREDTITELVDEEDEGAPGRDWRLSNLIMHRSHSDSIL